MATHIHRRLDDGQVRLIFSQYDAGSLTLTCALGQLGVKRRRFFGLLSLYRKNPGTFSIAYTRETKKRLGDAAEAAIVSELKKETAMIKDRTLPIRHYNYSAVRDALKEKYDVTVSVPTIIMRAKEKGWYQPRPEKRVHDREVLTNYVGELIQHDSSHHRWAPLSHEMWYSITSIDDYSRLLLFADLVKRETSWEHIRAVESVVLRYGAPLRYYPDQHSIFRFVEKRDGLYQKQTKSTDDVDPQWKRVLKDCGTDVTYALSPQAKGKIERPYRWMQDRTVRRCAKENVTTFEKTREIFLSEVERYNTRQVHSTTKEIPIMRFERALREGKSMLRPFSLPKPYTATKDIFCLRTTRTVDAYRKISLHNISLAVPKVPPRHEVDLKVIPDEEKGTTEIRMWFRNTLVSVQTVKYDDLRSVHF